MLAKRIFYQLRIYRTFLIVSSTWIGIHIAQDALSYLISSSSGFDRHTRLSCFCQSDSLRYLGHGKAHSRPSLTIPITILAYLGIAYWCSKSSSVGGRLPGRDRVRTPAFAANASLLTSYRISAKNSGSSFSPESRKEKRRDALGPPSEPFLIIRKAWCAKNNRMFSVRTISHAS